MQTHTHTRSGRLIYIPHTLHRCDCMALTNAIVPVHNMFVVSRITEMTLSSNCVLTCVLLSVYAIWKMQNYDATAVNQFEEDEAKDDDEDEVEEAKKKHELYVCTENG